MIVHPPQALATTVRLALAGLLFHLFLADSITGVDGFTFSFPYGSTTSAVDQSAARSTNDGPTPRASAGRLAAATTTASSWSVDDLTVTVVEDDDDRDWASEAAAALAAHGVCALRPSADENGPLVPREICDAADAAVREHLATLHNKIRSRGVDPTGVEDGPYRFREVVCRDGCPRFDVPARWSGSDDHDDHDDDDPLVDDPDARCAIRALHRALDDVVRPVVDAFRRTETTTIAAAGFLVNAPGSTSQSWHRDGPDPGRINAFVPLVDLTEHLGPTCVRPGTHFDVDVDADDGATVTPLLAKGQVLLFDYRTLHRGLGNTADANDDDDASKDRGSSTTRTLAYAVYAQGSTSDVRNFPDALTLRYD